jgi:hypothetical protein
MALGLDSAIPYYRYWPFTAAGDCLVHFNP